MLQRSIFIPRCGFDFYAVMGSVIQELTCEPSEAKAEAAEVLRLSPNFSVDVWGEGVPYKDPAQAERDMAALRKAGLE